MCRSKVNIDKEVNDSNDGKWNPKDLRGHSGERSSLIISSPSYSWTVTTRSDTFCALIAKELRKIIMEESRIDEADFYKRWKRGRDTTNKEDEICKLKYCVHRVKNYKNKW